MATAAGHVLLLALAAALLASTAQAAAAKTTWSVSKANRWVTSHIRYVDGNKNVAYDAKVAAAQSAQQRWCRTDQSLPPNRRACVAAKARLRQLEVTGCQCVYVATRVACTGTSPATSGHEYARLRCKGWFVVAHHTKITAGWQHGTLEPTDATRAAWTWA